METDGAKAWRRPRQTRQARRTSPGGGGSIKESENLKMTNNAIIKSDDEQPIAAVSGSRWGTGAAADERRDRDDVLRPLPALARGTQDGPASPADRRGEFHRLRSALWRVRCATTLEVLR